MLQGNAQINKPYIRQDTAGIVPLKLVRFETPPVRTYRTGHLVAAMVAGVVLGGLIGLPVDGGFFGYVSAFSEPGHPDIPDFGKLLVDKFSARVKKEIRQWPDMAIVQQPVKRENYLNDMTAYTVEIRVEDIRIEMTSGIIIESTIFMTDRSNNTIWEKGYQYDPSHFNRKNNYDTLMDNNCKGLKEEYDLAVEKTVSDWITHFNDSLSSNKQIKKNPSLFE